tara:strand:- start:278 stop:562 length:285 start_codon:yes stop_codon:yes gene_type:complete
MSFAVSTSSFAGAKVALRKQQNVQKKQSTMVRAAAVSGEVPVRRNRILFASRAKMGEPLKKCEEMSRRCVLKEHSRRVSWFKNQLEPFVNAISI